MAEFYKGFVFECDVSAKLTIEGNPIRVRHVAGDRFTTKLPSGEIIGPASRRALAREYIRRSGNLGNRKRETKTHVEILRDGKRAWNRWRRQNPHIQPILANETLDAEFNDLNGYDFSYTNLCQAKLRGVHLKNANFHQANLAKANLAGAHVEGANFCRTDLYETNFEKAWFGGANLQGVQLTRTNLKGAHLSRCKVYGISAWDLKLDGAEQDHLIIRYRPVAGADREETAIVDGVDLASFMYLTINNRNISRVFDEVGRKWVLLLGRFSEGKGVLLELKKALRKRHYIPIIFDFTRPRQKDLIETVMLLAGMSAFVIVEITSPRSTPMELQAIASSYGVPIVPIMKEGTRAFGMFSGLRKFTWVLNPVEYDKVNSLLAGIDKRVIKPALALGGLLNVAKGNARPTRRAQRRK